MASPPSREAGHQLPTPQKSKEESGNKERAQTADWWEMVLVDVEGFRRLPKNG